jgi:peptidyl-tRNA hydrolase
MTEEQKKFELYLVVLRFLVFKITDNLKRIYMDVNLKSNKILLTVYYLNDPTEQELELLDDIVTNSNANIPDLFIESQTRLTKEHNKNEQHDFIVFAVNDEI